MNTIAVELITEEHAIARCSSNQNQKWGVNIGGGYSTILAVP